MRAEDWRDSFDPDQWRKLCAWVAEGIALGATVRIAMAVNGVKVAGSLTFRPLTAAQRGQRLAASFGPAPPPGPNWRDLPRPRSADPALRPAEDAWDRDIRPASTTHRPTYDGPPTPLLTTHRQLAPPLRPWGPDAADVG